MVTTPLIAMLRAAGRFLREVRRSTALREYDLGEEAVLWDFRKEGTLGDWDCICDRDVRGLSQATFDHNGKGCVAIIMQWPQDL